MGRRQALLGMLALGGLGLTACEAPPSRVSPRPRIYAGRITSIDRQGVAWFHHAHGVTVTGIRPAGLVIEDTPRALAAVAPPAPAWVHMGPADRWGVVAGRLWSPHPLARTLEERAVLAGWARCEPEPFVRPHARRLLALERRARGARRGLWADPSFGVRAVHALDGEDGIFLILQGQVRRVIVSHRRSRGWRLAFSLQERWGFTARITAEAVERIGSVWLAGLNEATVRVRGRIRRVAGEGAHIIVTEAAQIERLSPREVDA